MTPRRIAVALALGLVVAGATAARAEPVNVQAATRADMGRIVFAWPTPVTFDSARAGNRLKITFGRAIEADYGRVTRALGKYIAAVTPGGDGRSVTFTLKGDVDVYSFDSGASVIVEIVDKAPPKEDKAAEEKTPAAESSAAVAEAPKASGLPSVRVRAGRHPDYTRLVFDWSERVPYTVKQEGGVATITFDKAAALDLAALTPPPPFIGGARAKSGDGSATVTLAVPKSSRLKHFLAGNRVVVDVGRPSRGDTAGPLPPEGAATAATEPQPEPTTKPAAKPAEVAEAEATSTERAPAPKVTGPQAPPPQAAPTTPVESEKLPPPTAGTATGAATRGQTPALATAGATQPAAAPAAGQSAQAPTLAAPAAPSATGGPTRLTPRALTPAPPATPLTTPTAAPATPAATAVPPAPAAAPAPVARPALTPGRAPEPTAAATPPGAPGTAPALAPPPQPATAATTPIPQAPARPAAAVAAGQAPPGDAVTLRFDWQDPVGAAVFRRAGALWVAFDRVAPIDVAALMQAGGNLIRGIEQLGTPNGTVLRIATVGGVNPSLRRDGLAWLLDFRKQPLEPVTSLTITAQPDSPVGARLFVPVPEPGDAIPIIDPEVGDNLVIVPVIPLGHGMAFEYVYPQMKYLRTAQGVVLQPTADDIRVNPMREGVEVTSVTELQISAVSAEEAARAKLGVLKPLTRLLNLDPWAIKDINAFTPRRQELQVAAAQPEVEKRFAARIDLARFYFANGFFAESLGVLNRAAGDRPEAEADAEFRLLRGGALYMLGRLQAAAQQFDHQSLQGNDEAIFWLAATRAAAGDAEGAAPELKRTGTIVRPYPKALKVPLGTVVTNSALGQGDVQQAKHFIEILRIDRLDRIERAQLDYEEGRVLAQEGNVDEAIARFESVIAGPHRPSSAKAVVARTELLLKEGRIKTADAIAELEKLRFAWRGDVFEFKLLRRLGQLYIEDGLYRQGLTAYRQAATYYRTHPEAPAITQAMSDAFADLYLNDAADDIPPVTALAIYDEFKELTPAGPRGDEMIRRLADRLVGVDLIDRAANLLDNQVRFRLQGEEKARVGTQLALVHLLGREYDPALKVLAETEAPGLPPALAAQRRHIQAKVEIGKGNPQRALDILVGDDSRDAELLRTEVFWGARDWNNVALTMRRLLRVTAAKPGQPLDIEQASHVLNYAIALTLGGNERALVRLREDYGAEMQKTALKEPFRLISTGPTEGLVNPDDVGRVVEQVENFRTFLTAYRERLKNQRLSEIVPQRSLLDSVTPDQAGDKPPPAALPQPAPAPAAPPRPQAGASPSPPPGQG